VTSPLSFGQRLAALLIVLVVAGAYLFELSRAPVYLGSGEAWTAIIGSSLANSGRTLDGDWLPLFVRLGDPALPSEPPPWQTTWSSPLLFYLVGLSLRVLPFSETAVRLPMALIGGLLNPLLLYLVARRLGLSRRLGLVAALLLALSPAHFMMSRQALDFLLPVPFVLGWLLALATFSDTRRAPAAFVSGALLGLGCYTYVLAWLLMPALLLLSIPVFAERQQGLKGTGRALAGFIAAVSGAAVWVLAHPGVVQDLLARYRLGSGDSLAIGIAARYLDYFNPSYLFITGGAQATASTARTGVMLLPVAICLPAGIIAAISNRLTTGLKIVLIGGLLIAPLPAAFSIEMRMAQRALLVVPFAALLSAYGLAWLYSSNAVTLRSGAIVLLVLAPVQFGVFVQDYLTNYRLRSSVYFDGGVASRVIDRLIMLDAPQVLISTRIDNVTPRLRFYLHKAGRLDLLTRIHTFGEDAAGVESVAVGGVQVIPASHTAIDRAGATGRWNLLELISDVDQQERVAILQRIN
jgi:hypothetical protein